VSAVESVCVESIAVESIMADESGAIVGAGAAAGAAVLSMAGVSSCELQAASVSTTAARARRFIPISLRGAVVRSTLHRTGYERAVRM
jgi:hypothetical protein